MELFKLIKLLILFGLVQTYQLVLISHVVYQSMKQSRSDEPKQENGQNLNDSFENPFLGFLVVTAPRIGYFALSSQPE